MGCVKKVLPWIVDPVGTILHVTTGFDKTPGGQVNKALNTPSPPAPPPQRRVMDTPLPTIPKAPSPQWRPPPTPEPQRPKTGREGSGATAVADRTRGLITSGGRKSAGGSLLQ